MIKGKGDELYVKCSLVKKTDYNTKIAEREGKTPDVNKLGTKTPLTAAENKIPDVLLKNRL